MIHEIANYWQKKTEPDQLFLWQTAESRTALPIQRAELVWYAAALGAYISSALTRAPLGYFYNAPHWGGGYFEPPPLWSPKLLDRF